jgi:tetratricopeptide (TPR) repeat protein
LIGREKELTLLEDALLAANRGEGQVVVLAGEAGLGKTRLATQLQNRALKGGTVVIWGGCSEAELALPYLPFLEAVGNYLAGADVEQVRHRLGTVRRELAQLFPQLETESISHDPGDPTQGKLRLFEAILSLLRIPADEHGLLVVLEDLHWSDASTRELLDYLTRRLRKTRIMVLATYRSDELHRKHPLLPMVQGWRRSQAAQVVELEPLPAAQVASMVSAIFDGETVGAEFRDFMRERSEGNPFVIEELLKAALDRGDIYRSGAGWDRKALSELKLPPTVRDTILLRMERLGPEQADILRTAAVLGPSFAYQTLVAVSGREEEVVQGALHACVQQQLMEEEPQKPGRYRFRHALTREAIYEDMITPKREKLHLQAAEVLRQQPGTAPVDLAYHLIAANRWDEAIPMTLKAAEDAERRKAFLEAAALYGRTLSHVTDDLTRGQILCCQGNNYFFAGDIARAQPHLEEGIRLLEAKDQKQEAAKYRLSLGRCHWESSRPGLARAEYERALRSLEPAGPSEHLAVAFVRLAGMHLFEDEPAECLEMAQRAVVAAEAAGADAPRIWAGNFIGSALTDLGRLEEGLEFLDRSYQEAAEAGLESIAVNALHNGCIMRMVNFRTEEVLRRLELFRPLKPNGQLMADRVGGHIYLETGEIPKALQSFSDGVVLARETGTSTFRRWCER